MIRARGIGLRRGGREVLRGVDLAVAPGEVLALLGPNGAGKSSLLGVLSGRLRPHAGEVCLLDRPMPAWGASALARRRAVLSQAVEVPFDLAVAEVVGLGRHAHGRDRHDAARVARALASVGLSAFGLRPYRSLSGGERQRVQLARALCQLDGVTPGLLLLDEPTSAQDVGQQQRLLDRIRGIAASGRAVVVVLHDLNHAAAVADRVLLLAGGRPVAMGAPAEVLTADRLARVFGVRARVLSLDGHVHIVPSVASSPPTSPQEEPWT